ncbi:MAG: hypothetical protein IJH39_08805, partial [Clostridia bacterium]|nr:hypothetical protein [Clostridia bacterium]
YAALTTNLSINGTATVKAQNWNVHFTNIVVDTANNSVASVDTAPTLSENDTKVTWEVSMDTPGQVYKYNVDVINEGTIDAMVNTATNSIVTNTLTQAQQAYLDYTITYVNGAAVEQYDKLAAGETKTLTVRLAFKQDIDPQDLPETAQNGISLSYTANYVQADNNAVTKVTSLTPSPTPSAQHGPIIVGNDTVNRWDSVNYNPGTLTTANIELPEGAELQGAQIASVNLPSGASIDGAIDASQASNWKVLDVTEEGDVLIIPTTYDTTELTLSGMNGYNNAIQALNAVSSIYVNPTYAESARSITVDDINKVESFEYATGSVGENGITYSWNHRYGMNQNTFDIIDYGEGNENEERTYKMTEETHPYAYSLSESYSYLGDKSCWLASRCVDLNSSYCSFGVRNLNGGDVYNYYGCHLFSVYDDGYAGEYDSSYSVLPVVTLKSGIHMEKVNGTWELSE